MDEALPQQGSVDAAVDGEAWWSSDTVQAQRQRYALVIEYVGTDYHGSQRQVAAPGEGGGRTLTVQDDLEQALRKLVPHAPRAPVVIFSGRTDAGVHATGSMVHVDLVRCDRRPLLSPGVRRGEGRGSGADTCTLPFRSSQHGGSGATIPPPYVPSVTAGLRGPVTAPKRPP